MNYTIKYIISIIGIILATLSIIFGSYLPLVKAQRYITAISSVSSIRTLKDFERNFDRAFNFYSPVGNEEIAKFAANTLMGSIDDKNQPETASRFLGEYLESKLEKDNVRHLIILGQIYESLWKKSGKENDFIKSEEYFQKALSIGPKLPPVLYELFNLYQLKGDTEKLKQIGEIILKYWPEDEKVRKITSDL